jgi:hypothetical protein
MERIRLIAYTVKNGISIRNSRYGHLLPCGYNRSVLAESSTPYPNMGEYKGSNGYQYRGLPLSIHAIQGKRRITHSLDTTSTPPITTKAWLRLSTRNNTIGLHINTK